jgi:hypothetical protein
VTLLTIRHIQRRRAAAAALPDIAS